MKRKFIETSFMPRNQITLPETFSYSTHYSVLFSDLNVANHVGADRIIGIAFESQLRFLNSLGYVKGLASEKGFITSDYEVKYLSEAHYDDILLIELAVTDLQEKSFDLRYKFSNKTTGKDVAHIKTNIVCFDYKQKTVVAIPELLLRSLKQHTSFV